ncbi:MAG: DUF3649 domain-containing protein [Pseudomonadota bacterium]
MTISRILRRLYYYPTLSRILAAVVGAYIFANVASLLLYFVFVDTGELYRETENVNRALVASGFNALVGATLMSILIYPLAGMWVFYARSATRAWAVMILPSLLGAGLIYWLLPDPLRQALGG